MNLVSRAKAEELFGSRYFGVEQWQDAFAVEWEGPVPEIPFRSEVLQEAAAQGFLLLLRGSERGREPLTLARIIETFPDLFEARFLRQVGYQLKEEWGILLDPLAHTERPRSGWALVAREPLPASYNRTYRQQTHLLAEWGQKWESEGVTVGRRLAVEIVHDCVLAFRSRGERLLERQWDWSASTTADGAFVNVGGFTSTGLQIFAYSAAVRHARLGVCPVLLPQI